MQETVDLFFAGYQSEQLDLLQMLTLLHIGSSFFHNWKVAIFET